MTVKARVAVFGESLKSGKMLERWPKLGMILGIALSLIVGFIMSSARVMGACGPFGIGMVAAGSGPGAVACLIGASLGYILTGGFDWGIRYVASCMLVFTAGFVLRDFKITKTMWFIPMVTAAITAVTSFLNSFEIAGYIPPVVLMLTEVVLAGGSAYFFRLAISSTERTTESEEIRYGVGVLVMTSVVFMAFAELKVFSYISIGRIASVLVVMMASKKGGALSGAASGVTLGLAMDISSGGAPFFAMAFAFSGLISGVFFKHGRLLFSISYILSNGIAVVWTWSSGMRVEALYEVFIASVMFLILPSALINSVGVMFQQVHTGSGEGGLRRLTADRLRRMGTAFQELFDSVRRTIEDERNENDIAIVFDRAADSVCTKCARASECWQNSYLDTLSAMNDATKAMLDRGSLERSDLPVHFLEACTAPNAFINAVNAELRGTMYRRRFRSRLSENRSTAIGHYADFAEIMNGVSKELFEAEGSDPLAERRLIRYLRSQDIDAKASVFRDGRGRLRAVIETGRMRQLTKDPDWIDKMSGILGVRLCKPANQDESDGRLVLVQAEPLAVSVGISAIKKKGEPVSGDRGTYFKTENGVLCVILSDGMGSGEEAAKESIEVVRILERFLRSGVRPATAMKMLNSVMLLKNGDDWGYATVDLMCIDLFTGEACFYKYGAAPSYVRNGKNIRRVRGQSMAAGIISGEGAVPDIVRMKLRPGSLALIASDGVLVEEDDTWLKTMLTEWKGKDTKALAAEAMKNAVKQYGCEDDMTVLAVSIEKRT